LKHWQTPCSSSQKPLPSDKPQITSLQVPIAFGVSEDGFTLVGVSTIGVSIGFSTTGVFGREGVVGFPTIGVLEGISTGVFGVEGIVGISIGVTTGISITVSIHFFPVKRFPVKV